MAGHSTRPYPAESNALSKRTPASKGPHRRAFDPFTVHAGAESNALSKRTRASKGSTMPPPAPPNSFSVYILRCSDDSLYVGHTSNLEERLKVHNDGRGALWTASRRPVILVYWEPQPSE